MPKPSLSSKTVRVGVAVTAVTGLVFGAAATSANAADGFSQRSMTTSVSGSTVTATAVVSASSSGAVSQYGICARTSSGGHVDFGKDSGTVISRRGTSVTKSRTLDAGTYTVFPCVYANGRWWDGEMKSVTVGSTAPAAAAPAAAPAPAPTTSAAPASGSSMPVGNLSGWRQTETQDFTSNAALGQVDDVYGGYLAGYDGWADTSGRGLYDPDSVLSVSNGVLDFYLHNSGGTPRVAAPVPFGYEGQTYGRYSVRFKTDEVDGYKMAFLLWPASNDWNDGEIDWPDGNLGEGLFAASAVKGTYNNGSMTFDPPYQVKAPGNAADWVVATTEWTPGSVKWYWNDVLVGQTTNSSGVPDEPMRWTLQAETAVNGEGPGGDAGHLQVDWVVQYAYAP